MSQSHCDQPFDHVSATKSAFPCAIDAWIDELDPINDTTAGGLSNLSMNEVTMQMLCTQNQIISRDNVVRVVDVKTSDGIVKRPVAKLCCLEEAARS